MKPTIEQLRAWTDECCYETCRNKYSMSADELTRFAELAAEWAIKEHEAAKAAELTPKIIQEACAIFFDTARNSCGDNDMYAAAKFILSRVRTSDPRAQRLAESVMNGDDDMEELADAILAQPAPKQPKPEAKPEFVPFDLDRAMAGEKFKHKNWLDASDYSYVGPSVLDNFIACADKAGKVGIMSLIDLAMLPPAEDSELTTNTVNAALAAWENCHGGKFASIRAAILEAKRLCGWVRP